MWNNFLNCYICHQEWITILANTFVVLAKSRHCSKWRSCINLFKTDKDLNGRFLRLSSTFCSLGNRRWGKLPAESHTIANEIYSNIEIYSRKSTQILLLNVFILNWWALHRFIVKIIIGELIFSMCYAPCKICTSIIPFNSHIVTMGLFLVLTSFYTKFIWIK